MRTLTPYLGWVARAALGKGTSRREARYDLVSAVAKRWGFRLNQRMVSGGMIVCDDYGFPQTPGAKDAMDQFLADKPEPIIKLASGHALILKQG